MELREQSATGTCGWTEGTEKIVRFDLLPEWRNILRRHCEKLPRHVCLNIVPDRVLACHECEVKGRGGVAGDLAAQRRHFFH